MKGSSLKYLMKEGARNLWSNRLMSFASVGVLTACLLLVGFAILFSANVNNFVNYIENQNEMVVFLSLENSEERNLAIGDELRAVADVDSIEYFSRDAVWELEKEKLGDAGALLEENGDNPFLAYYKVTEKDLAKLETTAAQIEQIDGVEKVNASKEFAGTILNVQKMVTIFGTAIIAALVLVSLVIIANTIRAAVFTRRKEINIMKYVGATDGFIRFPFMVEGIILGVIAAVLSFLLIWAGYAALFQNIRETTTVSFLSNALKDMLPFREVALTLGLSFLGAGALTGMIGSLISIRSHLKV